MLSPGDLDNTFAAIKNAARIMQSSPLRRGNTVFLPARGEAMITGDLHADTANFDRIVETARLDENPRRHLVLQELVHRNGPAGGECRSCVLIEKVSRLVGRFPNRVHVLMGNHEMAELARRVILKDGASLNGALKTSAGARYGERVEEAMAYFRGFWRAMILAVRAPNRVFISHSTPSGAAIEGFDASVLERPLTAEDMERRGAAYALVWGRDFSEAAAARLIGLLDADCFIVGHTPCPEGFAAPNGSHVILDSQGHLGTYLVFPLDAPLTCRELVGRIRPLWL